MIRVSLFFRNVIFTEQSPVLRQAATALGLKSNVWVEEWMLRAKGRQLAPSAKAPNPTKVTLWKPLELYNADQLLRRADHAPVQPDMDAPQHTSMVSRRPYGKMMAFEMESIALKHSYRSKWWVPSGKTFGATSEYITTDTRQSPHKFFITGGTSVYPLELLAGDDVPKLLTTPISGATRRFFSDKSTRLEMLREFAQANNFPSYLFFTDKQLAGAGIALKPGAEPIALAAESSSANFFAYNIEQLENYSNILESMGRYGAPEVPVYLFSGIDIRAQAVLDAQPNYTQKYWVSQRDVEENQWKLRSDTERPVSTSRQDFTNSFFNVMQLADPTEGFARAGLLEMMIPQATPQQPQAEEISPQNDKNE